LPHYSPYKSIWLSLTPDLLQLAKPALELGFRYHNCLEDRLTMVKWIAEGENKVPMFAHHYVGCGGVVKNTKGKVVLVKENC
jgi:hypothetical protein